MSKPLPRILLSAALVVAARPALAADPPPPPSVETAAQPAAPRRSRIQGAAYVDRHHPVVGATVLARPEGEASRWYLTATDEDGRFRIDDLAEGRYRVGIERQGYVPVLKAGVEVRFPFRAVVEVPMQPLADVAAQVKTGNAPAGATVDLTGEVRRREGRPLGDVTLRLVRPGGDDDPERRRTAEDGRFALDDLVAGGWQLEVRGAGFLTLRADLDLERDATLTVLLVPQPAGYQPSPLDLVPPEEPIPPPGLAR